MNQSGWLFIWNKFKFTNSEFMFTNVHEHSWVTYPHFPYSINLTWICEIGLGVWRVTDVEAQICKEIIKMVKIEGYLNEEASRTRWTRWRFQPTTTNFDQALARWVLVFSLQLYIPWSPLPLSNIISSFLIPSFQIRNQLVLNWIRVIFHVYGRDLVCKIRPCKMNLMHGFG